MSRTRNTGLAAIALLAVAGAAAAQPIPAHPRELGYPPLAFEVPRAEQYRHQLSNGVVVYVVEDRALPLVNVSISSRVGSFLEPAEATGLAALTGTMLRQGGTERMSAEELDERVDFLAANLGAGVGDTSANASLSSLSNVLDESLELLFDMIQRPRFQQDRLEVEKGKLLEAMKQRNDHPASILGREWDWLLYGTDHFSTAQPTAATLAAIERPRLQEFHTRYWRPEGMVVAVSGDVETAAVLARLEELFARWPAGEGAEVPWPPPPPRHTPRPGLYHVEKEIPQGRVQIGHLGLTWDPQWADPESYAVMVMNDILGGGGFTSRITQRVRSDEGLAYSAGSAYGIGVHWPGIFRISFQSRNPTVGYAAKIALDEVRRIRETPVSPEELRTSKNSFIETFPRRFDSSRAVAALFASDELLDRPHDYWYQYRARIEAVDAAAVQRAVAQHLHPDRMVALVVGPWEEIVGPDADPRGSLRELFPGTVQHLPQRDPLTLEPLP
jgi:zinc protease